jgi:N-ethylmaleimide reductase
MAPLTRGRSGHERVPNDLNLEYYVARASAGLIITEGASFSDTAHGWAQSAAIQTDEQAAGWKKVVDAVHKKGGLMCIQLWHAGDYNPIIYHGCSLGDSVDLFIA